MNKNKKIVLCFGIMLVFSIVFAMGKVALINLHQDLLIVSPSLINQSNVENGNQVGAIEWYNNTFFITDYKVRRTIVRGQDVRTENLTVENTQVETEIFNLAHGEDYLIKGKMEEIHLYGLLSSTTGVGFNTLTIRVKYAGNEIGQFNLPEANRNDLNIEFYILTTVREGGATGNMILHSNIDLEGVGKVDYLNEEVTIDTTTPEALTITAEWSDADTANSLTILQGRALSIDDNQWI